ncbi:MAG TPA: Fic family protein [Rhizomicrobium sp.]|nr:Fic family protein [Rhizomicrobium sp.]
MYDAVSDPYCYKGTTVLKNIPGLRTQAELDAFEAISTAQRADEPLPNGKLSVRHYRAIHRHLFQDVYAWAGRYRTVRISKDGSAFCYPENIARQMRLLFDDLRASQYLRGLTPAGFAKHAAQGLSTLNAIHPFREGNGRAQTTFLFLLAAQAGHPLDLDELDNERFLAAMVASFTKSDLLLVKEIRRLMR